MWYADGAGLFRASWCRREPCPHRIIDDVGGAFAMGVGGGSIWHMIKGMRNSPKGGRLLGGFDVRALSTKQEALPHRYLLRFVLLFRRSTSKCGDSLRVYDPPFAGSQHPFSPTPHREDLSADYRAHGSSLSCRT